MTIPTTDEPDTLEVIEGLSWDGFEAYLARRGDSSTPRVSYLEGTLQLMSPSLDHEVIKRRLVAFIDAYLDHVGLRFEGAGAWLLKNAKHAAGLEPDDCYIVGELDKARPDLAVEVVWKSGGINKLKIYERLGVPEVWFWKDDVVQVFLLTSTGYERRTTSGLLPEIPFELLPELLALPSMSDVRRVLREKLAAK